MLLYEKLGYLRTGKEEQLHDNMTIVFYEKKFQKHSCNNFHNINSFICETLQSEVFLWMNGICGMHFYNRQCARLFKV